MKSESGFSFAIASQPLGRGGGEVIWTKSKRTAVFLRRPFLKEITFFFWHRSSGKIPTHSSSSRWDLHLCCRYNLTSFTLKCVQYVPTPLYGFPPQMANFPLFQPSTYFLRQTPSFSSMPLPLPASPSLRIVMGLRSQGRRELVGRWWPISAAHAVRICLAAVKKTDYLPLPV